MILSVSRRTDIPGLYMPWFLNRLEEGFVRVINPMNRKQVREINFSDVEVIVFWTKNPKYIRQAYEKIKIPYFLQVTITPYDKYEKILNHEMIIEETIKLSQLIGKDKIIWRYDPIIINADYDIDFHLNAFEEMCILLSDHVHHVIISCYQDYRHLQVKHNPFDEYVLIDQMNQIAKRYGLKIQSCVSETPVARGACLDSDYLYEVFKLTGLKKDKNQRSACSCVESIDIGAYSTCIHGCDYCYAVKSKLQAQKYYTVHNLRADHLGPPYQGDEVIKKIEVFRQIQLGGI